MNANPLESVGDVFAHLIAYLPTLLAGLIVLVLGVAAGWVTAKLLVRLLLLLRLDRVLGRLGWGRALAKGDVRHSFFELLGTVCGVLMFLVFLDNAVAIWKLTVLSQLLDRLVLLIPRMFSAGLILLVGAGLSVGVARAVQRALHQEEFGRAELVARLVRAAILVMTVAIVLVQLDIAVGIVTGAFLLTFGALALSVALAFGLGSRRAVEMMWEERLRRRRPAEPAAGEAKDR